MMTVNSINYLNIFFMCISAWLAVLLPLETFLFSYAVLGPLHYLTEINWLKTRQYFVVDTESIFFKACASIILFGLIVSTLKIIDVYTGWIHNALESYHLQFFHPTIDFITNGVGYFSIIVAIALIIKQKTSERLWVIGGGLIVGAFIYLFYNNHFNIWFAMLLPTIVHVLVFTGLFVMYGAVKSATFSGWLSLVVYVFCSWLMMTINHNNYAYHPSVYTQNNYSQSNFGMLNAYIYQIFIDTEQPFKLNSNIGLKIQSLVAFSYTYHYLNWFSKTSIIKWHQIKSSSMAFLLSIWFGSLALYWYDYKTGLIALYFLSILHVIMEFPLNIYVIKELTSLSVGSFSKSNLQVNVNPKAANKSK